MEYTAKNSAPIAVSEASSREVHIIEYIAGLDCQLTNGDKVLESRLRSIPDAWRQYRIARSAVDKVIRGLYRTLPDKTLKHMVDLVQRGEIIIRPKPVVKTLDDVQIVQTADLKLLINTAIASECAVCLKEPKYQKKCALRKALMCICPPTQLRKDGLCSYVDVARNCDLGEYI